LEATRSAGFRDRYENALTAHLYAKQAGAVRQREHEPFEIGIGV
jgi:hypothetical protein